MGYEYDEVYRGYDIMANEYVKVDDKIMNRIIDLVEFYAYNYSKTFVVTFGLNFSESDYSYDNKPIEKFMDRFLKYLDNKTNGLRPLYFWVREKKPDRRNHHYHVTLLLDGNRINSIYGIMEVAKRIWSDINNYSSSYVYYGKEHCMMLRADSPTFRQDIADCIFRLSYYAKVNSKNTYASRGRRWAASQVPPIFGKYVYARTNCFALSC